jgi:TM2 domain-containing membrane protein YozV
VAPYDPQAKSKIVAGLLGIFLGGFGVHRFYLGFTKIGVIQIIVTIVTCGIGSLWGFVEGILYLVGSDNYRTDATGRPLRE